ncbi:MAG: glycosyltransferase family 39 protein [Firmicutes bacterium]|nr:glycosyltransferase family 39 protein [Bacillota bacterium]
MSGEALKRTGYLYFVNKLYLVFLVWLTRDVLGPFLPASLEGLHPNALLDSMIHWDVGWYLRIASQGYDFNHAPFFPMLPFLIKLFSHLTGDGVVAGFLVTNTALFFACYFLYRLAEEEYGKETALLSVFILLFFPTAVFFSTIYSESLLLAFALGAFHFARRGRWIPAVFLGACAALSRNTGVVLFFAFLYLQYRQNNGRLSVKKAWPLFLIPASLSIFMFLLWQKTGDPLAFAHSLNSEFWGYRHFKYPGAGQLLCLSLFFQNSDFYCLFESGMAILFILVIFLSFRYIKDGALLIYLVLGFLIPFSSVVDNLPLGMPRYILVLFPGYVALARWLMNNGLVHIYSIITVMVYSVITVIFVLGRWIS